MGRRRKADTNDVVVRNGNHYVIVVVRKARWSENGYEYGLIETDHLGRYPKGGVKWVRAGEFQMTGRKSRTPGKVYRANIRAGGDTERGCTCQCCPHSRGWEED